MSRPDTDSSLDLRMLWKNVLLATAILLCVSGASLVVSSQCSAQGARHPFAVGANEGAADTTNPVSRSILALESNFSRMLTGAVRATKESGAAAWTLIALSFAYGVVHAAGPGHGKAVIATYLLANEKTFSRGVVISVAAGLLQGWVAIAIVATMAFVFKATSKHMTEAASSVEIASYALITILGCQLVYKKAKALLVLRPTAPLSALEPVFAGAAATTIRSAPRKTGRTFAADDRVTDHQHSASCNHFVVFDPGRNGANPDWKAAALTVLAAGLRPCSGAILVLVFSLAQGLLLVGILAVAAMSLGTAATTSVLAAVAVFAKKTAARLAQRSKRSLLFGRVIEATAAVAVLVLGLVLLTATLIGTI
jgi:nickel/cobalt exporter